MHTHFTYTMNIYTCNIDMSRVGLRGISGVDQIYMYIINQAPTAVVARMESISLLVRVILWSPPSVPLTHISGITLPKWLMLSTTKSASFVLTLFPTYIYHYKKKWNWIMMREYWVSCINEMIICKYYFSYILEFQKVP